jgi:hypothetical protein
MAIDFSKLSDAQRATVRKLIAEAEKQGVDPNLALAVAWSESQFKQSAKSEAGAIGVMQVMPSTATLYNRRDKLNADIHREDDNIRAGVHILKDMLATYSNPRDAVIAYNTTSAARNKYFASRNDEDLPQATRDYVSQINDLHPLTIAEPAATDAVAATEPAAAAVPDILPPTATSSAADTQKQADFITRAVKTAATAGAGAAGAGLGTVIGGGGAGYRAGRAVLDAAQKLSTANAGTAGGAPQATLPGGQPVEVPPRAPMGGKATYNYGRAYNLSPIEAIDVPSYSTAQTVHKGIEPRIQKIQGIAPGFRPDPRYGDLWLDELRGKGGPRVAGELGTRVPVEPLRPLAEPSIFSKASSFAKAHPIISKTLSGGLGAAGTTFGVLDTLDRALYQNDPTGAAISGVGTAAGLASLFPPAWPVALPVMLGAPALNALRDMQRGLPADEQPLTQREERESQQAAYSLPPQVGGLARYQQLRERQRRQQLADASSD